MNKITIEICAEDRALLERINTNLERFLTQGVGTYPVTPAAEVKPAEHPVENPFSAASEEPAKLEELPAETQTPWDGLKVERADIQRKVVELSGAGKKAEVRDIVKAYADKVSGIPEDKLAEVMAKLTGLEG